MNGSDVRTKNLLMLHDGGVCPHPLMDRMVLARMPHIEVLRILVVLGVGHDEANGDGGSDTAGVIRMKVLRQIYSVLMEDSPVEQQARSL